MALLYENIARANGYGSDFVRKVRQVSRRLGIKPNWLMAVMRSESGLNHRAVNPESGNVGLIQFGRSTAWALGTTLEELLRMSAVRQLDYVEKYYQEVKGRIKTPGLLYVYAFGPAYFDAPGSSVMARGRSAEYHGGKYGRDGRLTKAEFIKYVNETRFKDLPRADLGEAPRFGSTLVLALLLSGLVYLLYRVLAK